MLFVNDWKFIEDRNLLSYLNMKEIKWDAVSPGGKTGMIWRDFCDCDSTTCFNKGIILGKTNKGSYLLYIYKCTDDRLFRNQQYLNLEGLNRFTLTRG